jgi:anaerobic selenocysteine-containing dehydrogenase
MEPWVKKVQPAAEKARLVNNEYPMILMSGNHMETVANTNMRDPAWNEGGRARTMRIHPSDAAVLDIRDEEIAFIETEAGSATVEAEITDSSHRGQVVIPTGSAWYIWKRFTEKIQINLLGQGTGTGLQQRRYIGIFVAGSAGLKDRSEMAGFWRSSPPRVSEINCRRWARGIAW